MTVFPENMNIVPADDVNKALGTLDEYIRYMRERIEFSFANMNKTVTAAGVSSVTMYEELQEAEGELSSLSSRLATLQATLTNHTGNDNIHVTAGDKIKWDSSMIPHVTQTNTARAVALTGDCPELSELVDGQSIIYRFNFQSNTNATLELTLADGSTTGAVNVYYGGTTRLTTHCAAGNDYRLTYHKNTPINGSGSYTGWWVEGNYDANTVTQLRTSMRPTASGATLYGTQLIFWTGSAWRSITTSRGTGTAKTCMTDGIPDPQAMLYFSTAGSVASGSQIAASTIYRAIDAVDFRYSSNCGTTLTAHAPIYLVWTRGTDGLYYLAPTWWTQTLPTSDDGYIYEYVGDSYSTYQFSLSPSHPMYVYKDGGIKPYS